MTGDISDWVNDIHCGDAAETLAEMPANSIHCMMTSPPYYGLRDYSVDGQIGLEDSLDEYIQELLDVAGELRRVLRPDASWWLNLGDSFAGSENGRSMDGETKESQPPEGRPAPGGVSLRRKSKMLVPHRVAIALQDQGWIVRSDAVWAKPNPMPHPVQDRLHEHKEFLFHVTPEPEYWFDLDAIREPHKESSINRADHNYDSSAYGSMHMPEEDDRESITMDAEDALHPNGKNPGDILDIPVRAFSDAHFAVYPPELVETPLKATCPPKVCSDCGAPYERETVEKRLWERDPEDIDRPQARRALELADEAGLTAEHMAAARAVNIGSSDGSEGNPYDRVDEVTADLARETKGVLGSYYREYAFSGTETVGSEWRRACGCPTDDTQPGIVLDPFAGAGTTCLVAKRLGRRFIGIDLNPEYVALAQKRVGVTVDEPWRLLEDGETNLQAYADGGGRSGE